MTCNSPDLGSLTRPVRLRVTVTAMGTRIGQCQGCGAEFTRENPARIVKYADTRKSQRHAWRHAPVPGLFCVRCASSGHPAFDARTPDALSRPAVMRPPTAAAYVTECESCGVPLLMDRDGRRQHDVCSNACRIALYRQPSEPREARPCERCGEPMTGRADRRYCSTRCRVAAHRTEGNGDLLADTNELSEILYMAECSDEVFEEVLQQARAEGDASRANVIRLLREHEHLAADREV